MAILAGILSQVMSLVPVVPRRLEMDLRVHEEVEALPRLMVDLVVAEATLPTEDAVLIMEIGLNPRPNLLPKSRATLREVATMMEAVMTPTQMMKTMRTMTKCHIFLMVARNRFPEPMSFERLDRTLW